jgi:hypothetical protein
MEIVTWARGVYKQIHRGGAPPCTPQWLGENKPTA